MTGLELLEKYPLAAKVVKDWFLKQLLDSLKDNDLPDDFKNYMLDQGIEDDKVAILIDINPRVLLDVFDKHELFIYINRRDSKFEYGINELSFFLDGSWNTRKEAEAAAIESAFKLLENNLTPKEEENN